MALFERPSVSQFNALLHLGFAARLRAETADLFVTYQSDSLSRTAKRQDASLFIFVSGDKTSVEKPIQAAVLSQRSSDEPHRFLYLGKTPTLESIPTLLKLQVNNVANPRRLLFSISCMNKPRRYISMHGVKEGQNLRLRDICSKWELFHLEIIPGTVGKVLKNVRLPTSSFLTVPQAISQALLLLGVRIRLRSVHSRVLHCAESEDSAATILQTGAKSSTQSSRDSDLIFTCSRFETSSDVKAFVLTSLKEVNSGRYFAITSTATDGSCAKLVDEESKLVLRMSDSPGRFHIGVAKEKEPDNVRWLMAGPGGRLEVRSRQGSWETFTIEFVQQSYNAALANCMTPELYILAKETTRAVLRSEIAAKVAVVKGEKPSPPTAKKTSSGFNHAAALSGLSDAPVPSKKTKTQNKPEATTSEKRSSVSKKTGSTGVRTNSTVQKVAAAAAASATSSLPRNKANRKRKKSRKKQKGKPSKPQAKSTAQTRQPSLNQPQDEPSSPTVKENSEPERKVDEKPQVSSSRSEDHNLTTNGPKCGACGLPISGPYTKAMGKNFHPQCFCCGLCRRPMSVEAGQFRERGGIPYCYTCYANKLAPRCARCSKPIMDTVITAMDKTWHQDCLTCSICRLPLTQTFWLYANKPNEPRCSRCVTGEETVRGGKHSSSRMVNLPGFGPPKQRNPQLPLVPLAPIGNGSHGSTGQPGRARLTTPMWPPVPR